MCPGHATATPLPGSVPCMERWCQKRISRSFAVMGAVMGAVAASTASVGAAPTWTVAPGTAAPPAVATSTPATGTGAASVAPAFTDTIAGTAIRVDMMAVPACDGAAPFFAARTEVPWELFDAFLYQLDQKAGASTPESDAVTRPTKPYVSVDRGYGHQGWPAISMSSKGAVQFCEWLSKKTGRTYRLPTVAEWQCMAKQTPVSAESITDSAWTAADAKNASHKIGSKKLDAIGLADLWGNAAEWCVAADGTFCILGGSFKDKKIDPAAMKPIPETEDWNESDPQFPKSVWWLVDGPYIGMRVVTNDATAHINSAPSGAAPAATEKK
jgi:formylglycine-generating enzyme required for sulfatase activity